jgi:hypothetical protein
MEALYAVPPPDEEPSQEELALYTQWMDRDQARAIAAADLMDVLRVEDELRREFDQIQGELDARESEFSKPILEEFGDDEL